MGLAEARTGLGRGNDCLWGERVLGSDSGLESGSQVGARLLRPTIKKISATFLFLR